MANIPSYNQIDYNNDSLLVIDAKKKAIAKQEVAERASQAKSATSSMKSKAGETNELAKEFKETAKQHKIEGAGTDPNAQDGKNDSAVQEKAQEMDDQAKTITGSLSGAGAGAIKKKKSSLLDKAKSALGGTKGINSLVSTVAGGVIASKVASKLGGALGSGALGSVAKIAGTAVMAQGLAKGLNSVLNGQKTLSSKKTANENKTATSASGLKKSMDGLKQTNNGKFDSIPKSIVLAHNTIGAKTKK